jgi:hypothetical protein
VLASRSAKFPDSHGKRGANLSPQAISRRAG